MRYPGRPEKSLAALFVSCVLTGCGRAPTFNILGSFFPAWLFCLVAGIIMAVVANRVFVHYKIDREIVWSIIVYPCIALFFACTTWLIFFS